MEQKNQQSNASVAIQAHISAKKTNILSIVSLVFALLSLIATWVTPVITEVVAIICGHIARSQIKKSQGTEKGDGLAIAGLIIGYTILAVYLLIVCFVGIVILNH